MKKYDEKLRKYVSIEEYERTHKPQDKHFCKGKRPHEFVLVLPEFVTYNETYKFNPQDFYRVTDELYDLVRTKEAELEKMGMIKRYGTWHRRETRLYMCAVCKKKKYEYPD